MSKMPREMQRRLQEKQTKSEALEAEFSPSENEPEIPREEVSEPELVQELFVEEKPTKQVTKPLDSDVSIENAYALISGRDTEQSLKDKGMSDAEIEDAKRVRKQILEGTYFKK